jgi:hypothetical protein
MFLSPPLIRNLDYLMDVLPLWGTHLSENLHKMLISFEIIGIYVYLRPIFGLSLVLGPTVSCVLNYVERTYIFF